MSASTPQASSTGTDASDDLQDSAESAARSPWVERLGSMGFIAKGVLYVIVAAIAGSVGFVGGGQASQTGAISQLGQQSFGTVLLIVLAIGLASYTLLRLLHVVINPSGEQGAKGVGMRFTYLVRAVLYGGLTVFTITSLGGGGGGGGGSESKLTRQLLDLPAGRLLVGAVALIMLGVGLYQLYTAATQSFMGHLEGADQRQKHTAKLLGMAGHAARGIVFGTIGVLFARAALQSDSSEAGGVDKALQAISSTPLGTVALVVIAIGLAAYGLFCCAVGAWGTARKAG